MITERIRKAVWTNTNQKVRAVLFGIMTGLVMGFTAKLADARTVVDVMSIFSDLGGRFGIWIFTAAFLAAFSKSPGLAAAKVFAFFAAMLFAYYAYTVTFLGFFPKSQIIYWSIFALLSPLCAYILWYSRGKGWPAIICAALPVAALIAEIYVTGSDNLLLQAVYLCMGIGLVLCIPYDKKQCVPILLTAIMLGAILIKLGVLTMLFDGWLFVL